MIFIVVIVIFNDADVSLSMKWNLVLIPWIFQSSFNSLKAWISSLSLLLFIAVVRI